MRDAEPDRDLMSDLERVIKQSGAIGTFTNFQSSKLETFRLEAVKKLDEDSAN
jgi:hypothetical protein